MKNDKPKAGVILTLSPVYKQNRPELSSKFAQYWQGVLSESFSADCAFYFPEVAYTAEDIESAAVSCEVNRCDVIVVLPMAYAPSEAVLLGLKDCKIPIVIVSTARDLSLRYDMVWDDLLANQSLHGCLDLTNILKRTGRQFHLLSGHPKQQQFCIDFKNVMKAVSAASILRRGRIGRIGGSFKGMLDFTFDTCNQKERLGFEVVEIAPEEVVTAAENVADNSITQQVKWLGDTFQIDNDLTKEEIVTNCAYALALQQMVIKYSLKGISLNFAEFVKTNARTVPFLGASILLAQGIGYAGEGDLLTTAMTAAVAQLADHATFTEFYSPDYERNEIFLTHKRGIERKPFVGKCDRTNIMRCFKW